MALMLSGSILILYFIENGDESPGHRVAVTKQGKPCLLNSIQVPQKLPALDPSKLYSPMRNPNCRLILGY